MIERNTHLESLPSRNGTYPQFTLEFGTITRLISVEWMKRKKLGERLPPMETANGYLKRQAYRIISHYVSRGQARFFEYVIRDDGRGLTSRVRLDENPFHFGLLALFPDDTIVSRQDRSLFALQMLYAYHHGVPSTFLIGFLYQAGSKLEIKQKLHGGYVEPGFEATYQRDIGQVRIGSFR